MKLIDNIVNKIGQDKLLHFAFGGLIAALIGATCIVWGTPTIFFTYITAIIGTLSVAVISFIKELCFDNKFDTKDILYSVLGTIPMYIAVSLGLLLNWVD